MRTIDADRLLTERMKSKYYHLPNGDIAIPIIDIEHAPTIDAVEVVRCKECRWSEPNEFDDYDCRCHIPTFRVNADGYCSYGERKGE